jgi:O-antigen/teichoic acid export membrane protein
MLLRKTLGFGAPALANVVIRLISVPIITYYMGPEDIGKYAVVLGFVAIFLAIASSFSSYVVSYRYFKPDDDASSNAVFTCIALELGLAVIGSAAMYSAWPLLARWSGLNAPLPFGCIVLAAISIPLSTLWQSVTSVVVYEGQSRIFALASSLSTLVQVVVTALYLYEGAGLLSLFIGYCAGTAVTAAFALPTIHRHRSGRFSRTVLGDMRQMAWMAVTSNIAEAGLAWLERVILSKVASLDALGIYYHSQNYRHVLLSGTKAVSMAGHRRTVEEARSDDIEFLWTKLAWTLMFSILMSAGVGAALVGREIVAFLTHDKFTKAAALIPLWCIVLLFQQAARPQQYKMMTMGEAKRLSKYKLVSLLVGMATLPLSVPVMGMYGAVLSILLKESLNRGLIYIYSANKWGMKFSDHAAVIAALIIIACSCVSAALVELIWLRISLWICISSLVIWNILRTGRRLFSTEVDCDRVTAAP